MAKNRIRHLPERLRVTIYPHMRTNGLLDSYYQAGILVEEIPGVVDFDYIYYGGSMKKLIQSLINSKSEWKRDNVYAPQIVQQAPGFEKIFLPRHALTGDLTDMSDRDFREFQERFQRVFCKR